jgi:TonB-linked SusC/RagA family outer membrane protein
MKKLLLVSLCFLVLLVTQVFAQNRTVTGTVTAKDDGLPIPGVSVKIKGTSLGTQTGTNGKYTISVPANGVLVFSFIGYSTLEKPVGSSSVVDASLTTSSQQLGEVVVTGALGIKKADREVGYATTLITGNDANEAKPIDPINGLTGKVAGLVVQQTGDGIDPTIRVTLRGNRSMLGNNQALFVVDGAPVPAAVVENLNPDDIESYNVLNGSGAAALYGSEASNGAIVITTKKGTASGKPVIIYNNSVTLSQVANFPELQANYGQYGGEGAPYINPLTSLPTMVPFENQNYGMPFNGSIQNVGVPANSANGPQLTSVYSAQSESPIKAFFQTGVNEMNNVSFRQGDAANYFSLSARNINQTGEVPLDEGDLTNVRGAGAKTYGIFKVEFSADYTRQVISQFWEEPDTGGLYSNLLQFPENLNIQSFRDVNNPTSFASENNYFSAYSWNPWWGVYNSRSVVNRDQFQGFLNLSLTPTKWLDVSYRLNDNFGVYRLKNTKSDVPWSAYALTIPEESYGGVNEAYFDPVVKPSTQDVIAYGDGSGGIFSTGNTPNFYGDQGLSRLEGVGLLNLHHNFFNNLKTNLLLGNDIWSENVDYTYDGSSSLVVPGYYNVNTITGSPSLQHATGVVRQVAFFGDLQLGWKGWLTLEGTLRNDRSSLLSASNQSFYYPSVKASFIPTDAIPGLKNNDVLDYWKLYADLSRVGQISVAPYSLENTYSVSSGFPYGSSSGLTLNTTEYSPGLKPEIVSEQEFGTEIGLFKDRLHLTADYYYQKSHNQTIPISISPSTGYTSEVINAGEIDSWGEEFSAQAIVFPKGPNSVGWTVGGNFAINDSKVVSLLPGVDKLEIGTQSNTNGGNIGGEYAVVGQAFPQLYVTDYNRDSQGRVIVNSTTGVPTYSSTPVDQGRTTPKYTLGLNTSVSYKIVTLNVVADYRAGNVIYNGIGSFMDFAGSSAQSAAAGRSIFIFPNSVINTGTSVSPSYTPNTTVPVLKGGWEYWSTYPVNVGTPYVSSAAFWRIREVSLAFKLDQYIKKTGFIKGMTFALTGRNLFLFLPKSEEWGDPELSNAGTTSNAIGGNDTGSLPSPRVYGADLNVTF